MIKDLEKLAGLIGREKALSSLVRVQCDKSVLARGQSYPLYSFHIGSADPQAPVVFITGGVHGLERIGAQLAWSLLKTTVERLLWDKSLMSLFSHVRLVVVPLVNPIGYVHFTRANGQGVDLMRNSPVQSPEKTPFLLGGQKYSAKLPWFQGLGSDLEIENQHLLEVFQQQAMASRQVISVDFHSGFGMKDRLWFPYSYTKEPFENLAEMQSFARLLNETHPYHVYHIEPQSKGYLLNGDMWDYIYLEYRKQNPEGVYLPLTLEMGSWNWVRKNPLQIFQRHGAFNPIKEHRLKRTYRRHHLLFDFLLRSAFSYEAWAQLDEDSRHRMEREAKEKWY